MFRMLMIYNITCICYHTVKPERIDQIDRII